MTGDPSSGVLEIEVCVTCGTADALVAVPLEYVELKIRFPEPIERL